MFQGTVVYRPSTGKADFDVKFHFINNDDKFLTFENEDGATVYMVAIDDVSEVRNITQLDDDDN